MTDALRRFVTHNFRLKLIALIAAVSLWAVISREPVIEVAFSVPVEFHDVPQALEITSEIVPQAQVRLRGPARSLRDMTANDVRTAVSLAGVGTGERTFDLTPSQVSVPQGVEVVQVVPAHFRLGFDRRAVREVPVKPRVTGRLPAGFSIAEVTAEPATITLVGPEKHVNVINEALTDPIDATGVMGRATFITQAYVADQLVREMRPARIRVIVVTEKQSRPAAETP
ncbi:MAG TPA: CdaR family protein [Longimicrobiales bacterium]|nr:CdaR family protein [Longimicrobiales bacterium]